MEGSCIVGFSVHTPCLRLRHVQVNHALKHLSLLGNAVGDVGAALIADALVVNKTLRVLDLSRNYVRREVRMLHLSAAVNLVSQACAPSPPLMSCLRRRGDRC